MRFLKSSSMPRPACGASACRALLALSALFVASGLAQGGTAMRARPWGPDEVAYLRTAYADTPTADIAERPGRKVHQVRGKAHSLGLKKSAVFMSSPASGRLMRGSDVGASGRFLPGHNTWNKGMKGLDIGGKATRFQAGRKPHT